MKLRKFSWIAAVAVFATACDSPLDTDPTASIDAGTALNTKRGVQLALNGAYRSLQSGSTWSRNSLVHPDLYSDNLDFTGTFQSDREFSLRNVTPSNGDALGFWQASYAGINRANNIIASLEDLDDMTEAEKTQTRGEALFIRAMHYYTLVMWYGGVPIVEDPAVGVGPEAQVTRDTRQEVFDFIEADLELASTILPATRSNGRATKAAADALAARVYLEEGEYAKARDKASAVIGNTAYRLVANYADVFRTKNSTESIFELQYTTNSTNSLAFWFYPAALGGRYGFAPSLSLNNAFEAGDTRRAVTITLQGNARYGTKWTRIATSDDNVILLRLSEQYLIRAEANARLNADTALVRADINTVRARAGLAPLGADIATQAQLLDAILRERRVELAFEGFRFFDLRRFGLATTALNLAADKLILPVPQVERDVNPNLVQNPGY